MLQSFQRQGNGSLRHRTVQFIQCLARQADTRLFEGFLLCLDCLITFLDQFFQVFLCCLLQLVLPGLACCFCGFPFPPGFQARWMA